MSRPLAALAASLALVAGAAHAAEPAYFTEPRSLGAQKVSMATDARAYRMDVARYVYESYPTRIWKGKLPPLVHAVVVVETTVDGEGRAAHVSLVRGPSHAPDVSQAVMKTIRRLSPLPLPSRLAAGTRFTEIWLVHKNGQFQLDALTEGQIYAGR
jgi:protein TonB